MHQPTMQVFNIILIIISSAVIVESLTEIITSSDIAFKIYKIRLRNYIMQNPDNRLTYFLSFVDQLTSCGYCCSVWVSVFVAAMMPGVRYMYNADSAYGFILDVFLYHRLSNLYHAAYELLRRGRVTMLEHNITVDIKENEVERDSMSK